MANDISLAVGDGSRRMTYAELAAVRGISLPSARRLVLRHRWARQTGNDGVVRVTVPLTALAKPTETQVFRDTVTAGLLSNPTDPTTAPSDPTTDPMTVTLTALGKPRKPAAIAVATTGGMSDGTDPLSDPTTDTVTALEILREQLAAERARVDGLLADLRAERGRTERAEARAAELWSILAKPRGWRRWFR
jgi:hypothetical protein